MPLNQFTYFLLDKTGKFYYVDKNGKVRLSAAPMMLPEAPEGWDEVKLSWGKSATYLGLTRTFSVPLKFVFDGAVILRYLRYNFGIDVYCRIVIHKLNKSFGAGMLHEDYFPGEIDFSKWNDADEGVTTEIKDAGPASLLKANENTAFNIPYKDDARAITVKLDGIYLHETYNWLIPNSNPIGDHILSTIVTTAEGSAFGFAGFTILPGLGNPDVTTSPDYFAVAMQAITGMRLKGRVTFSTLIIGGYQLDLKLSSGVIINVVPLFLLSVGGHYSFDFDVTFDANENDKLFLVANLSGIASVVYQETTLSVSFQSRFKTTFAQAFHLKDVFATLMEKLTGAPMPTQSSVFDLVGKTVAVVLVSGDSLRGFDTAKLRTSWSDFFKSVNVIQPIGFSIDKLAGIDTAIIEDPAYFLNSNLITDLGQVADFIPTNPDDYMGNTIKIGYPNQEYDQVNGRDEFNVTQVYTTPITKLVKEIDMVSAYRADAFGIEYTRINLEGKTSTDSDTDNAVFMLLIDLTNQNADGSYNLYRGPFTALSGLVSPDTMFNIPLSPKTCLIKHGSRWRSIFYRYETSKITFQTSDKNAELSYTIAGKTITEKDDVLIGNFPQPPKWLPYLFPIKTLVPTNLLALMEGPAKYGIFKFETRTGKIMYGYVIEVSQQPANNEIQEWKLLCASQTNVNDLIYNR